jgi:hypothetical protein
MERTWAMPNKNTYQIKPIHELLATEVEGFSVDPFCRTSDRCTINSDINGHFGDLNHDALDFLDCFSDEEVDTVLFDPPYSPRQVSECYKKEGIKVTNLMTSGKFWADLKDEVARITHKGSKVISFGWNSGGMGKSRGFEIEKILLVAHGGGHNDTIVTIERKITENKKGIVKHVYLDHDGCGNCGVRL